MSKKVNKPVPPLDAPETMDKTIAKTILRALKLRTDSYDYKLAAYTAEKHQAQSTRTGIPSKVDFNNFYARPLEDCLAQACKDNEVPVSLVTIILRFIATDLDGADKWARTYNSML